MQHWRPEAAQSVLLSQDPCKIVGDTAGVFCTIVTGVVALMGALVALTGALVAFTGAAVALTGAWVAGTAGGLVAATTGFGCSGPCCSNPDTQWYDAGS